MIHVKMRDDGGSFCQTLNEHSQQAHDFDQTLQQLAEQVQREQQQRLQKQST